MKRIHIFGLTILAMLLLATLASPSTWAAGRLLLSGSEITSETAFKTAGELSLEDMGATGKPDILCSVDFSGDISPAGVLLFINVYTDLVGKPLLSCVDDSGLCSSPVEVEPLNLPWHVDIDLIVGIFRFHFLFETGKTPGYKVDCKTILGLIEDKCEGETSAQAKNESSGVLLEFGEGVGSESGECTLSAGKKEGLIVGSGLMTSASGTLSLSE